MLKQNMLHGNIEIIGRSRKEKLLAERIWLRARSIGTKEISILYIYRRRQNKKRCKKHKREWVMRVRDRKPHWLVRSQQLQFLPSSLFHSIGNSRARHSNLASPDRLASMPFWSHPQCIGIHFKGVQSGWRPDRSEGSPAEGARSSSTMEAEKLRETGWEKRIQG